MGPELSLVIGGEMGHTHYKVCLIGFASQKLSYGFSDVLLWGFIPSYLQELGTFPSVRRRVLGSDVL